MSVLSYIINVHVTRCAKMCFQETTDVFPTASLTATVAATYEAFHEGKQTIVS